MHFYEFNIGDYAKKTQHLTNEEDLAYRRLLDLYYDSENPVLTSGLSTLSRRLRVSETALKNVLDEFFPNGKNKHADEKIAEYHAYLLKQSENGKKGGRPKNQQVTITSEKVTKPTDNQPLSQSNPVPSQTLTTKPLTTNQVKTSCTAFALPDWIDKGHWDLWMKTRKGKKMIPEQMQSQVKKLEKWKHEGFDYQGALFNAASNGYTGLFLPDTKKSSNAKTPAQDNFSQRNYGSGVQDL